MDKLIIDTSAWIEAFRPQGDRALVDPVKALITSGRVILPGIIKAELLRGARDKKEFTKFRDLLEGLTYLGVGEDFWERLSEFSFGLYRKGVVVPLTDTYIALLCIENSLPLLHRDKHFEFIAQKTSLRIFPLPLM